MFSFQQKQILPLQRRGGLLHQPLDQKLLGLNFDATMPPRRAGKVLEVSQKIDWGNFTPSVFPEVRWGSWSLGESCVCVFFFVVFSSFVSLPEGIELFWQDSGNVFFS